MTTSVSPLRTTVAESGKWPVRRFSKSMAASAICWAMVGLVLSIAITPIACGRPAPPQTKKADVVEHPEVFDHVGLLGNEPPDPVGLPFL